MAESEENKAAVEYWDRVAASSKGRADAEAINRNRDRAEEKEARRRADTLGRGR